MLKRRDAFLRIGLLLLAVVCTSSCADLLPPVKVHDDAYLPLREDLVVVTKMDVGQNGAGREIQTLYLVMHVTDAADGVTALAKVRQHFEPKVLGMRPTQVYTLKGYAGMGKSNFSVVTLYVLEDYLAEDRAIDAGVNTDALRLLTREARGPLVLVQLEP